MVFTMINKKNIYEQLIDISPNFILFNYNMKTLYPVKYIRASDDKDNKYMVDILLKLEYLSHSYRAIPVTMMSFSGQNIYFNYISDFFNDRNFYWGYINAKTFEDRLKNGTILASPDIVKLFCKYKDNKKGLSKELQKLMYKRDTSDFDLKDLYTPRYEFINKMSSAGRVLSVLETAEQPDYSTAFSLAYKKYLAVWRQKEMIQLSRQRIHPCTPTILTEVSEILF